LVEGVQTTNVVAGGYGQGNKSNELNYPYGLFVDIDNQRLIIADWGNHRIIQWEIGQAQGDVLVGLEGQGNQLNQLSLPTDVLLDKQTNSLFICDRGNRRILKWSPDNQGEIFVDNIGCWGIAMDNQRSIYISDTEKHQILKYKIDNKNQCEIVAGGHGKGSRLNQLNEPTYLFVDQHQSIYISDSNNFRVLKWAKDGQNGIVVAKCFPRGIYVDSNENIYVADYSKHRLMKWTKDSKEGIPISIGDSQANDFNQVYFPWSISSDEQGSLFVTDHFNHRVQRFALQQNND